MSFLSYAAIFETLVKRFVLLHQCKATCIFPHLHSCSVNISINSWLKSLFRQPNFYSACKPVSLLVTAQIVIMYLWGLQVCCVGQHGQSLYSCVTFIFASFLKIPLLWRWHLEDHYNSMDLLTVIRIVGRIVMWKNRHLWGKMFCVHEWVVDLNFPVNHSSTPSTSFLYVLYLHWACLMYICVSTCSGLQRSPKGPGGVPTLWGDGTDSRGVCWRSGGPHPSAGRRHHHHQERVNVCW